MATQKVTTAGRKRRKPRAALSRDRVLRTAIGLADREGIDALTMRRLASELGVEAMTLYHYVTNKDEILAGMIDLVAGEVELPAGGEDWKTATRRRAISTREVL
ncbi:MAG TPA: TetR family transcriptional regulator, partial [Candidatus Limnocylindria bacterium]|nr:TetR family transcriptional regulator [Candidatus Limnocylindria bacterium]